MKRIYEWLYKYSIKKLQDMYMYDYGTTLKCSTCNKWSHEKYRDSQKDTFTNLDWGYKMSCGNCGTVSYFNAEIGPMLILCDENGSPL